MLASSDIQKHGVDSESSHLIDKITKIATSVGELPSMVKSIKLNFSDHDVLQELIGTRGKVYDSLRNMNQALARMSRASN